MSAKGILGRKLGMTQIWDDQNRVVPVTVIEAGPCRVVQLKTPERDGYSAVHPALGDTKQRGRPKPGAPGAGIGAGPVPLGQPKAAERDGYSAVQLAFGDTKQQRLSKPELGH